MNFHNYWDTITDAIGTIDDGMAQNEAIGYFYQPTQSRQVDLMDWGFLRSYAVILIRM